MEKKRPSSGNPADHIVRPADGRPENHDPGHPQIPRIPVRFLRWFCRAEHLEEIEGDLAELFMKRCAVSSTAARCKFIWGVIRHFRPEFIRRPTLRTTLNPTDMLRHNILITYRNARRYKSAFFINLTGLSAGLAAAMLIFLWVADEFSVDKFHDNDARLYQVFQGAEGGMSEPTPGLLAETLVDEIPEVEYAAAVIPPHWFSDIGIVTAGDTRFKVAPQFVSHDFFNVFTHPLVEGNKQDVLISRQSVAISETLARQLFKTSTGVIGKSLQWSLPGAPQGEFFVSAVFQDVPANASLKFDILFSYDLFLAEHEHLRDWNNADPSTYVVLRKDASLEAFNKKIVALKKRQTGKKDEEKLVARQYSANYLHGTWNRSNGGLHQGRIQYVNLFIVVGAFLVIIACINFMNLATARASRRMKEIGIKKAVGAGRYTLMSQYLGEAMLTTILAAVLAIVVVWLLLPAFNTVTAKHLELRFTPHLVGALVGIVVFTGLLAGSYPAFYLSRFNPVTTLKGRLITSWGEQWARKGLVVVQFTASVVLIVSVLVVYRQIAFIQNKNLGYNRDNILYFEPEWKGFEGQQAILDEVRKIPGVVSASSFYHNLLGSHGTFSGITWEGKDPNLNISYSSLEVGYNFIETMGIKLIAGKTFSPDINNEKQIILNEEAVRQMGLKDPVGKVVNFWGEDREIVGVAQNFNFESLYSPIRPCLFRVYPAMPNTIVKIQAGTEQTTIPQLESVFHKFNPGLSFDYRFLDNSYQNLYASEQRVGLLARYFSGIAILISCLGLFGLAAFTAERRVKEIGIRKILGATDSSIIRLLSMEFTTLVMVAVVIGLPVSYISTSKWLHTFAYHTALPAWLFALAGVLTLGVAFLTTATQTFRASRANPAETLKGD